MDQIFTLRGKVAVVTGGSRGLGRAAALGLARAGAGVVVASRTLSACETVAEEIEALGKRALAVACDTSRWDDLDRLVEKTYERFGRCDVLVNNAGATQPPIPLAETTSAFFDEMFAINVKGPMHLASLVAMRMGKTGGGTIINVISAGALRPGGNLGVYCSSKSALQTLTRVMADEWAAMGVRVNALAPGGFLTDMMHDLASHIPNFLEISAGATMQKRVADPKEIVGAVLFLASDASSFVTGQTLAVCGGFA